MKFDSRVVRRSIKIKAKSKHNRKLDEYGKKKRKKEKIKWIHEQKRH